MERWCKRSSCKRALRRAPNRSTGPRRSALPRRREKTPGMLPQLPKPLPVLVMPLVLVTLNLPRPLVLVLPLVLVTLNLPRPLVLVLLVLVLPLLLVLVLLVPVLLVPVLLVSLLLVLGVQPAEPAELFRWMHRSRSAASGLGWRRRNTSRFAALQGHRLSALLMMV